MVSIAFGKRINQLRKTKSITSERLAEICKVTPVHIRKIESGAALPSFNLFIRLCNVLGTSADFLLGDLLDNPIMPDCIEKLGNQLKHLTPSQIEMVGKMISIMVEYVTVEEANEFEEKSKL